MRRATIIIGLLVLLGCSETASQATSLTDAQRLWCADHGGGVAVPSSVIGTAHRLGIEIPEEDLAAWRQTDDYVRACVAAFELALADS